MLALRCAVLGLVLATSSVSLAQQPNKSTTKTTKKESKPAAPAVAAPAAAPAAQPAAPVPAGIESQPAVPPASPAGQDTYEQSPAELQQMACEMNALIKSAEAKAGGNESADARASREALITARKRELRGVLSVFKKVTGQTLNLDTACK